MLKCRAGLQRLGIQPLAVAVAGRHPGLSPAPELRFASRFAVSISHDFSALGLADSTAPAPVTGRAA